MLACPCSHDSDLELVALIKHDVSDHEDVFVRIDLCELEVLLNLGTLVPVASLEGSGTGSDQTPCCLVCDKCALETCEEVCILCDRSVKVEQDCL